MAQTTVIDNTNLVGMCNNCGAVGFVPRLAYAYDAEAATVTITNTTTLPTGETFVKNRVRIHDEFGAEVRGTQTVAATPLVIDVSTLNLQKGAHILATLITTGQIVADGAVHGYLQAAGTLAYYDIQKNA